MTTIKTKWVSNVSHVLPKNINILLFSNNLTETITKSGLSFSLNLLDQSINRPFADERSLFQDLLINASQSLVRKVILQGDKMPMVFARVIIPQSTYKNYQNILDNLGNSPIGPAFLYKEKQIKRGDFSFKLLKNSDPLLEELKPFYRLEETENCWARRSLFILPGGPILITEVFLKDLLLSDDLEANKISLRD